ncbi:transcription antitermination protein NusB [Spiroplasma helicoides]|uniref:Transcription antitermination protein NusB n=1 Tax=Spiroplasma helicoides TaxID=216938 RepID=A0A1B3SKS8_9MOLU|nr:transcription antitermination factor NusB [Spiroplasma helicoides]AOG60520.1 transcription antitermination protein NusB [Spiroplasma helicoides]
MQKNSINYLKKRRRLTVQIIYKLLIFDENKEFIKQELLDGIQFEEKDEKIDIYIEDVVDQFENIKEKIKELLSTTWKWERIPNMTKAILVTSIYEINKDFSEKAIIIDEALQMVREYIPSENTAFVNGLLDKIDN